MTDLQMNSIAKATRGMNENGIVLNFHEPVENEQNSESEVIILPVRKVAAQKLNQESANPSHEVQEDRSDLNESSYDIVGHEILNGNLDPKCWAKALAEGGQTRDEALSNYARLRVESLTEVVEQKNVKDSAFEKRKLVAGVSRAKPLKDSAVRVKRRNRSYVLDFVYWQALTSLSGIGILLTSCSVASGGQQWWPGLMPLVFVSAVLQLVPVAFFFVHRLINRHALVYTSAKLVGVAAISLGMIVGLQIFMGKSLPLKLIGGLGQNFITQSDI